jgi:hypothetical protein
MKSLLFYIVILCKVQFHLFIMQNIVKLLDPLPIHLEPDALLAHLAVLHNKGDTDNDTLGHAYYTCFYGKPKIVAQVEKPRASSLLSMYTPKQSAPSSVNVDVVQLTPPTVYVASICDKVNSYVLMNGILPARVFCQVIRDIHPHELRGTYYHDTEICGGTFDSRDAATESEPYLTMVNRRLHEYFSSGRSLDDVLSGMKKCLCLRMLSNNMYYYRDNQVVLDPVIQRLMHFYTLSGFLHLSSQAVFDSHYHMILKYKTLMDLIEEFIKPEFTHFLAVTQCRFDEIARVEPGKFVVRIRDDGGIIHILPHTFPMLQAFVSRRNKPIPPQLSSTDMIHKMDEYMHPSNPRLAFDEGIRFMNVLIKRLDTEKNPDDLPELIRALGKLYELTLEPFMVLIKNKMNTPHDDETIFRMMQIIDEYDARYRRPTKTNPMRRYLNKLQLLQFHFSPSPRTKNRSRSSSPSYSRKRSRNSGGAKSTKKSAKKFTKTRKS